MNTIVDIPSLPVVERLRLMESLWDSLCAERGSAIVPVWHADVLAERTVRLDSGEETTRPWSEAK